MTTLYIIIAVLIGLYIGRKSAYFVMGKMAERGELIFKDCDGKWQGAKSAFVEVARMVRRD